MNITAWLQNPDLNAFDQNLRKEDIARIVGTTHAFIKHHLMAERNTPLLSNQKFLKAAQGFISNISQDPRALDTEKLEKEIENKVAASSNPLAGLMWSGKMLDFATQNGAVLHTFADQEWSSFDTACQECVAYTFQDFPQPLICAQYAMVRIRSPHEIGTRGLAQIWSTFGWSCTRAGHEDGAALARQKLTDLDHEHFADYWEKDF